MDHPSRASKASIQGRRYATAHGQMGLFGSVASPKLSTFLAPVAGKQAVYFAPMVSPLQVQCQSFPSEPGMSKPPEVVPKDLVLTAKQTQVLYMAQEPEAWNLQAAHALALSAKALSASFAGRSSAGRGGSPNFPALEGRAFKASTDTAVRARPTMHTRIALVKLRRGPQCAL